ncbi:retrotransposon protein, putative, ty1-copia subclass [Tanacetum coccineum]
MTTTVVNNSLFRSLFKKQKLTRNNFMEWYRNLWIVLSTEDKLPFLEQPIPTLPVPPAGQVIPPDVVTTHQAWVKAQKEIAGLMLMTMDPNIQKNLEHLGAYDMLKELKKFYIENLERLGHAMTQNLSVSLILVSPRKEYDGFVQNYNMHSMGKTVTELHAMLNLHEQTLPPKEVAPALHAIRAGRIQKNQKKKSHKAAKGNQGKGKAKMGYAHNPPTPKKDTPAKDAICHQCGEVGQWRRNCPIYLAELMKKKKLSQGASTSGLKGSRMKPRALSLWQENLIHIKWKGPKIYCEIIHTLLCGPFKILSRQGASYFVTFTDDFSRYGYVYLLKHKHEVFETFKVFQKEVENQLGKTIKSLRSDRGGEYISQEFLDHLRDHGIIAHRTPPYTPQHNGVSERRNRTLLDMVRSMMSQTTLPKSFWDYALESATRILNMVLTKKVEKIPYERMKNIPYALAVGLIMYVVRYTRLEVAFAQNIAQIRVSCSLVAGYLTDADDMKSQTGYVFILNGGLDRLMLLHFLDTSELTEQIGNDNHLFSSENGHINVEHISGELQRADILTKALPRLKFVTMRQMLGVQDLGRSNDQD